MEGVGSWLLLLRSSSDLGQMSTKMECVCVCVALLYMCACVVSQVFGDCLPLTGTGRHFAGLYCHMPLPILPLIRAATAGTQTFTCCLTRQSLAHTQSPSLCMWLASHCVVLCSDQTEPGVGLLSGLIGGSDEYNIAPLLFCSSGCCQLTQCQICCKAIKGPGCHNWAWWGRLI